MRFTKFLRRGTVFPICSFAFPLVFLLTGGHSKAAAQSSPNITQNSTQPQNGEKRAAKKTSEMPGAVPGATYVGSDTCKGCHDEIYSKHFQGTPHFALLKAGAHGCEDCHGPGSAHVEGNGDKTKIIRFAQLSPEQASRRRLQCHESSLENMNFMRSVHFKNGVGCLGCHSPHHSTQPDHLLKTQQTLLCYACHATQKAEFDPALSTSRGRGPDFM